MPAEIRKAREAYKNAGIALSEAVKKHFPEGTTVTVTINRARIVGVVVASGSVCWWHDPDRVLVRNLKTGKIRNFSAADDSHEARVVAEVLAR